MAPPDQLDRIEQKLDRLLNILGAEGSDRLPSEIKREAQAMVLSFQAKRDKKRGHEREIDK